MKKTFVLLVLCFFACAGTILAQSGMAESGAVSLTSRPPASAPDLVSPEYPNTDLLSCRARLIWENMDHVLTFNVQIANDYEFNDIVGTYTGIEDTIYVADLPANSTNYNWRVSATNRAGTGSYGYIRQFKTSDMTSINVGENAAPTMTDIDADGLLDMLVGNKDGRLTRYEQTAANSFSLTLVTSYFNSIDVGTCNFPTVADLDKDGLLDLIIGRDDGTLRHFEQDSDRSASFTLVGALSGIDVGGYSKPTFTDLDLDGRLDLLVGNLGGAIYHYEQVNGTSTSFTLVSDNFNSIDIGGLPSPMFCYYDSDDRLEFFIGNEYGNIQLYQQSGVGSSTFNSETTDWNDIDVGDNSVLAQTDLDGNGYVDMLVGSADGIVGIRKGENYSIDTYLNTDAAKNITPSSAELGGNLYNPNGVPIQRRGVVYGTTNPPTLADEQAPMGSGYGIYSGTVSGLAPNTTYYYRTFGSSCYGTFYGSVKSFTTNEGDPRLAVKVFLEGAYDDNAHAMRTDLSGSIPATSPYADSRNTGSIPAGITDWVYLELRSTADGAAVYGRSCLLRSDGYLAENDGAETSLTLEGLTPGNYFIVIKHRNHLAVESASAQSISSTLTTYNFTVDAATAYDKYHGGQAALLENGDPKIYGLFAGEINGTGTITTADKAQIGDDLNEDGYYIADTNLSGIVTTADKALVVDNLNKSTQVSD